MLVSGQTSKVETGKVENGLPIIVHKLRARAIRSLYGWDLRKVGCLLRGYGRDQWFRLPFVDELVDLLDE